MDITDEGGKALPVDDADWLQVVDGHAWTTLMGGRRCGRAGTRTHHRGSRSLGEDARPHVHGDGRGLRLSVGRRLLG